MHKSVVGSGLGEGCGHIECKGYGMINHLFISAYEVLGLMLCFNDDASAPCSLDLAVEAFM